LIGWSQFLFMVVMLGLIVLVLVTYDGQRGPVAAEPQDAKGPSGPGGPEEPEGPQGAGGSPLTSPAAPTTP
ncbi:MAG: hypothetical protein ACJ736_04070, partial [Streptomyces sp.]